MATSPFLSYDNVIDFEIQLNGSAIDSSYQVQTIEIEKNLYRITQAKLNILLPFGTSDDETFDLNKGNDFLPGSTIEIKLGSVGEKDLVFQGIIVKQSIRNYGNELNQLAIHCSDKAVKMTLGRKSAYYENMKDNAIISAIVGEYGLSNEVTATNYQHKLLVKYQANDWDFLVTRAEANGLLVYTEEGKVLAKKPLSSGSPLLTIEFGKDVLAFDCSLDARSQASSVSSSAWDLKTQAMVEGKSSEASLSKLGNVELNSLGAKIGLSDVSSQLTEPLEKSELSDWASAQLLRERMNGFKGQITTYGNASPKLNTLIELKGFGSRYNGNALVSSITHTVKAGVWRTTLGFGLAPEWYHEQREISAPAAGGVLPAVSGLLNGTVKKIDADPDGQFRVQVDVPVIEPSGVGIWARLSNLYATSGKGSFFFPEVGDEVVLGFLNDDPRYPVILGMLYSSKLKPAYTPDSQNKIKAIVTKNELKIEFNDTDKVLTIKTPAGNEFVLSDQDKSVSLKDQNGNKLVMDNSGITINSMKDVIIKATGKVDIQGTTGVSNSASGGDVSLEGLNVQAKAKVSFSAQGSASAELKAAGNTSVKGAIVMIN
jgi:Rhs element Vgr protein